jgi:hypothetical protein
MEFGLKNQYTVKTANSSSESVVLTLKSVCLSVKTTICLSYRALEMTRRFFFWYFWSEWKHFQPFKYRRRAESSELYSKPSEEVQTTLHGTPLLQCTQITNGDLNAHIQRGKRKPFTVPNQVAHCLIITCTHTHRIFNNSKSTKMQSKRVMSR